MLSPLVASISLSLLHKNRDNAVDSSYQYRFISMQSPTDEASIPTENEMRGSMDDEPSISTENERNVGRVSGAMKRKVAKKTYPWTVAAPSLTIPAAKKPRLEASTSISVVSDTDTDTFFDANETDTATIASLHDTVAVAPTDTVTVAVSLPSAVAPTDTVTAAVSLPSAGDLRAIAPRRNWKPEEVSMLIEAVQKFGNDWVRVAKLLPDRTNTQCCEKWVKYLGPSIYLGNAPSKGKWTAEEDATLTDAVEKLGNNDWVQVAVMVPSRTNVQCRHRWAESLDTASARDLRERAPRRNWKPEEDATLTEAVKKHGDNWVAVAALVPGRTNKQVSVRWRESLSPSIDQTSRTKIKETVKEKAKPPRASTPSTPRRSWKPEEDAALIEAVKKHGDNWVGVAKLVPGRTNNQCCSRWSRHLNPTIKGMALLKNCKWTAEEDMKLTEAVTQLGNTDWIQVAALVPGRTNIQCRQRWVAYLVPINDQTTASNKGKWTEEETEKLVEAVKKHGCNNWIAAAALVPGRTSAQCRQRWVLSVDPTIDQTTTHTDIKGKWTVEEDAKLTEAVKKLGRNWVQVAAMVLDRTNKQCRHRWVKTLDPNINTGKWSGEEDAKLTGAVQKFGNDWVQVAAMIPGRTNAQCRDRWMR
jgi:hypothetical protein